MKKECFAYIRVSTAKQGQHGSSLQEQRDAINTFAQRHSLTIVEWFEDRETAAKKGRTQFMRMMAALEKRSAEGVILHKIDRGARNLWDWARIQDLIDSGVEVHFAHDNLDLRSRGGRLAADIQAVVAADYVRNLRDEVRKGFRGRLKQGFYPLPAPLGYLNRGKAQAKVIDPVKGPLVKTAFELYASKRHSFHTLSRELLRRGLTARSGKPLTLNSIALILRNPFYIGLIRLKQTGETFQGLHEPLIDGLTFKTVQDIIDGKSNTKVQRHEFAYRRLLSCGQCGRRLTGERQRGHIYYRCHTRTCAQTSIREEEVTASLVEAVGPITFSTREIVETRPWFAKLDGEQKAHQSKLIEASRLRIAALQGREERLTDAYLDQTIGVEAYNGHKRSLLLELTEAKDELRRVEHDLGDPAVRAQKFFEHINTLVSGPTSENVAEFRDAVEILTSNRNLFGKKLDVAMPSPFREMSTDLALHFGGPYRGTLRTLKAQRLSPSRVAQIIARHLRTIKDWPGEGDEERRPNPSWFKPKSTRLGDDLPMAA